MNKKLALLTAFLQQEGIYDEFVRNLRNRGEGTHDSSGFHSYNSLKDYIEAEFENYGNSFQNVISHAFDWWLYERINSEKGWYDLHDKWNNFLERHPTLELSYSETNNLTFEL